MAISTLPVLQILSRPGCELCEQMEDQLHTQFPGQFKLDWRDVDRSPQWRARYGHSIPVLLDAAGAELCSGQFDAPRVAAYLRSDSGTV